jgi:YihY family inner membrane protein
LSAGERFSRVVAPVGRLWSTLAGAVTSTVDGFDRWQRRRPATAVPSAVVRKYSDDRAGQLAGQISYAAFLAVFPMLLVLLTLVGVFLHGHRALQDEIINAALRQFPVLGTDVRANIHQLSASNVVVVVVGTLWLLYGATKLSRASQVMMASVWDIDRDDLPDFWHWIPRAAGFLVVLGVGFIAGGALAGLGAFGRLGVFSTWIGFMLSLVVNVLMYWGGFAIVVHIPRNERAVWPGAVIAGAGWTLLQFGGALLVSHQLRHLTTLYGTFATVLGLIWWIALGAVITVYAAEANVVLTRHLWPRSLRRPRRPDGVGRVADGPGEPGTTAPGVAGRPAPRPADAADRAG